MGLRQCESQRNPRGYIIIGDCNGAIMGIHPFVHSLLTAFRKSWADEGLQHLGIFMFAWVDGRKQWYLSVALQVPQFAKNAVRRHK